MVLKPRGSHAQTIGAGLTSPKFPVILRRDRRDEMRAIITSCADCWTDKRMLMRNLPGDINRWSAWQNRTTTHCCWVKGCSLTTTDMMETHRIPSLWKTKWNRDALFQNHRLCSRRAKYLTAMLDKAFGDCPSEVHSDASKSCLIYYSANHLTATVSQLVQWLSSQICNVCALLETSTKFGVLVDMVAAMSSGYRTTSTAPPGGWWRHILNVSTWCHINVHNFVSKRIFFILFSDLYSGDVYWLSV